MSNIFGAEVAVGERKVIPVGQHDAVLYGILQNGVHDRVYKGAPKPPAMMIKLLFEIPEIKNDDGTSVTIGKEVPALVSDKANFFKLFKSMGVINKPNSAEIDSVFGTKESTEKVLGSSLTLTIEHFEKKSDVPGCDDVTLIPYIFGSTPLHPKAPVPEGTEDKFLFTFSEPCLDTFKNKVTKYGRKRIMSSKNCADLPKEFHEFYISEQEEEAGKGNNNEMGV